MNIIRHSDPDFEQRLVQLAAPSSLFDPVIEERTRAIIEAVRNRSDEAILEFTARFDGATLSAEQLPVSSPELLAASLRADERLRAAVTLAAKTSRRSAASRSEKIGRRAMRRARRSVKNLTPFNAWAFTSRAAPRRWFPPR